MLRSDATAAGKVQSLILESEATGTRWAGGHGTTLATRMPQEQHSSVYEALASEASLCCRVSPRGASAI